jgi:hypothetical protein
MLFAALAAGMGAAGAFQQGRDANRMAGRRADALDRNAETELENAEIASNIYGQREDLSRRSARMLAGQQTAAMAQSGAGMGGTNAALARQSAIDAELEALGIRYEGEMAARGHRQRAGEFRDAAGMERHQGRQARRAGNLGAATNLLMAGGYGYGASRGATGKGLDFTKMGG